MSDTDPQADQTAAPDSPAEMPEGETPETETPEVESSDAAPAQSGEADPQLVRLLEAVLFASAEPMSEAEIATRLPDGAAVPALIAQVAELYANRGVNLVQAAGKWMFRSAEDLAPMLRVYASQARKLSRAAIETLAICAYHQPITRAEMEEIRGVGLSKGTIDMLFEQGWIMPRGRRQTPGKPVTWGTTEKFLVDFGLESLEALPGVDELKAAGLLDKRPAIQITDAAMPEEEGPSPDESAEGNPLAEDDRLMADAAADFDNGAPAALIIEETVEIEAAEGADDGESGGVEDDDEGDDDFDEDSDEPDDDLDEDDDDFEEDEDADDLDEDDDDDDDDDGDDDDDDDNEEGGRRDH